MCVHYTWRLRCKKKKVEKSEPRVQKIRLDGGCACMSALRVCAQ